jgi:hypothetical protein
MKAVFIVRAATIGLVACGLSLVPLQAKAQSLSPSLSDSLAPDSTETGFDATYASGAGTIGETFHEDVTDATHSDLFGTSMSPLSQGASPSGTVNASSDSYGQRTDALQLSDSNAGGSRGGGGGSAFRSSAFGAAGSTGTDGFGLASASSAFRPTMLTGTAMRTAGRAAGGTANSQGMGPGSSGVAPAGGRQASGTSSATDAGELSAGVDPVLLPVNQGTDSMGGDILTSESPAAEAAGFFSTATMPRQTQFDDGVTPSLSVARIPGSMEPVMSEYSHAENGFPDSTQGTAASPLMTAEIHAPHGLTTRAPSSSAPDTDGNLFALKTGVSRDLFATAGSAITATARARAAIDRQFEQSVINGGDLADAEAARRLALQSLRSRSARRSTLQQNSQGLTPQPFPQPSVRDTVGSADQP